MLALSAVQRCNKNVIKITKTSIKCDWCVYGTIGLEKSGGVESLPLSQASDFEGRTSGRKDVDPEGVGWGAKFGPEGSSIIGSPSGNPE